MPSMLRMSNRSVITTERIARTKRARFNPIRNLTPDALSRQMDDFHAGILREFARTMESIERRDDVLQCVVPKRKSAIARRTFEIIIDPNFKDHPDAEKHKAALELFYANMRASSAIDMNLKRGFSLLVEQMMDAVGKKYAVHEIIWHRVSSGPHVDLLPQGALTATFNFCPLYFFENLTGKLRFLPDDYALEGVDMNEGGWMVTVGQGVMEACAVAYMFKHIPLKDWLLYCEKHGMPGILGKTDQAKGSTRWDALVDAVEAIAADFTGVVNKEDMLEVIQFAATGELPYPKLVERMDRSLAALWRGADLSTISAGSGSGQGASLQGEESHIMEQDDARFISETLQEQVDAKVIEMLFGVGTNPMAYITLSVPPKLDVAKEIQIDQHLRDSGVRLSKADAAERFGRAIADEDEEALTQPTASAPSPAPLGGFDPFGGIPSRGAFANEGEAIPQRERDFIQMQLIRTAMDDMAEETQNALQPLRDRIDAALALPSDEAFDVAMEELQNDLPSILEQINEDPPNAKVLAQTLSSALLNGIGEQIVDTR